MFETLTCTFGGPGLDTVSTVSAGVWKRDNLQILTITLPINLMEKAWCAQANSDTPSTS